MKYPAHIYDPIRYKVANSIISHELKKIFGKSTPTEYKKIEKQINNWSVNPKDYTLSSEPRDFWNGVEGIMTGFRIKGVVKFITAENVTWSNQEVNPRSLVFVTDHFFINDEKIPTLYKSAEEIINWIEKKGYVQDAQKKVVDSFSQGVTRVDDPIYCKQDSEGKLYIHDGNGRALLALLKGAEFIPAFVGLQDGEELTNYWISTILLVRFSQLFKGKIIDKGTYRNIMKEMFRISKPAIVEYTERVPDEDSLKEEILKLTVNTTQE